MNSAERIISAISFKDTDKIPVFPLMMRFATKFGNVPYSKYATDPEILAKVQIACQREFKYDAVTVASDAYSESSACGAEIEYPLDEIPRVTRKALYEKQVLGRLKVPDPENSPRMMNRIKSIQIMNKELKGEVPVFGWAESVFASAVYLRGMEDFMVDLYDDGKFVDEMLEFAYEMELKYALAQIKAGAKFLGFGDAAASLISPAHYEKYVLPLTSKLFNELKEKGVYIKYHICGNTTKILHLMAELNVDIINIDSLVDLKKAREAFPSVCIKGNIDPAKELLVYTPGKIMNKIKSYVEMIGKKGYIISPGCEVAPDTPHENFRALIKSGEII